MELAFGGTLVQKFYNFVGNSDTLIQYVSNLKTFA